MSHPAHFFRTHSTGPAPLIEPFDIAGLWCDRHNKSYERLDSCGHRAEEQRASLEGPFQEPSAHVQIHERGPRIYGWDGRTPLVDP